MASQPTEEDIQQLIAISGSFMSRDVASRRLKNNNNNVEQAINEYFEDPSSENKYKWDDSQFSSDRDGSGGGNNHSTSFAIHGPDEYPRPLFDMSRPPSRTGHNKSPLGKIIDLTAEHALANPSMSMSAEEQADQELQRAINMSLVDQGMAPQQQGITVTESVTVSFGPANRGDYESSQWAMVPAGKTSVQEIVVDPEPTERKRDLDAPAFLKPTVADSRLNALITMFHEIPMVRNVFLNITESQRNFGTNREWWSGERIVLPHMQVEDGPPLYDEIDIELQRLMAFLDKTERSYGSVDVLANLHEVQRISRDTGTDAESAVLQAWKSVFEHKEHQDFVNVIFSIGVTNESEENENQQAFAILELAPPTKDSSQETLYDIADNALWPNPDNLNLAEAGYLYHVAEVIAFKIEGGADHKRVDIPAVWYPDRYLKGSREAAMEMRRNKKLTMDKFERIRKLEKQLTSVPLKSGKMVAVKDLFSASLKHDENEIEQKNESAGGDPMDIEPPSSKVAARLSEELKKVLESIDKKLIALAEAKESACQELRSLSQLYTEPTADPHAPQLHKYLLRGVSTSKHTMYVCRRAEPDLVDIHIGQDGAPTTGDQWWHIHYAPVGSSPVRVEKTTEEKVLEAAKNESNNTLLVYASEKALNLPRAGLSKDLETFVKHDNAYFKSELSSSLSDIGSQSPPTTAGTDDSQSVPSSPFAASSPGKRKFEDDAITGRPVTRRATASISEREVKSNDDAGFDSEGTIMGGMPGSAAGDDTEPLIGVNPSEFDLSNENGAAYQGNGGVRAGGMEMQERNNVPMFRPLVSGNVATIAASKAMSMGLGGGGEGVLETIDGMDMDLDQVVQRDENVREESAASKAVRRVGFRD